MSCSPSHAWVLFISNLVLIMVMDSKRFVIIKIIQNFVVSILLIFILYGHSIIVCRPWMTIVIMLLPICLKFFSPAWSKQSKTCLWVNIHFSKLIFTYSMLYFIKLISHSHFLCLTGERSNSNYTITDNFNKNCTDDMDCQDIALFCKLTIKRCQCAV